MRRRVHLTSPRVEYYRDVSTYVSQGELAVARPSAFRGVMDERSGTGQMGRRLQEKIIEAALDYRILPATCQLLVDAGDGVFEHQGTGVLIAYRGMKFLVTAAHVLDRFVGEIFAPDIARTELRRLLGDVRQTPLGNDPERSDDPLDIGLIALEDASVQFLIAQGCRFTRITQRGRTYLPSEHEMELLVGFPGEGTELTGKPEIDGMCHATVPVAENDEFVQMKLDPNAKLISIFEWQAVETADQEEPHPTMFPHGMSGGGIWILGSGVGPSGPLSPPVLVGIMTDWKDVADRILSTRIDAVCRFIDAEWGFA